MYVCRWCVHMHNVDGYDICIMCGACVSEAVCLLAVCT